MENIMYSDNYFEPNRIFSLEYAGYEEDLAVIETENYIVFLTVVGNALLKKGNLKFSKYDEFPEELKKMIHEEGLQDRYGEYTVIEQPYFSYCISAKVGEVEEEFLLCGNHFEKIEDIELEYEKMFQFLNETI